jgi:hypothetical protein
MLLSAIHNLINSDWNKEELPDQWKESIIVPVHKKSGKTDCNNYPCEITAINFTHKFIEYHHLKVKSLRRLNYWGSLVWAST